MKTVTFTEFRRNASKLLTAVENGETVVILRHSKPIAGVVPFSGEGDVPAWKQPGLQLDIPGAALAAAIVDERETTHL